MENPLSEKAFQPEQTQGSAQRRRVWRVWVEVTWRRVKGKCGTWQRNLAR